MSNQKRREVILALLEENGKVYVNELAKDMNVSEKTIRRDLTKMEQEGILIRSHGGAVRPDLVESSVNQTEKVSEKSDGEVADKSDWDFTKNEQLEDEQLEDEETEEYEERMAFNLMNQSDSENSRENIKAVNRSKPEWLIKAIENTRPATSEEIEISRSGYVVKPIKSLRDINLKELENSISPDTLAELMKLANLEMQRESENVSELDKPVVEVEVENEELEGDELGYNEGELEERELEEQGDGIFDDGVLAYEEEESEEQGDGIFEDEMLAYEEEEHEKLGDGGFEDEMLAYEDEVLGDEGFEEESVDEQLPYEERLIEEQYYEVTETDDEQERLERSERLVLQARKDRLAETDKRRKPSEGKKKKISSKGKKKSPDGEKTKKPSTFRTILDWVHIILALIIFIGGIILAFYIIQTNRAQNMLINEGNIINESVICDDMSCHLAVDGHFLESSDMQIRIFF